VLDHLILVRFGDGRVQAAARQTLLLAFCAQKVESHRSLLAALDRMREDRGSFEWVEDWYPPGPEHGTVVGLLNVLWVRTRETRCRCLASDVARCSAENLFVAARAAFLALLVDDFP
jgi:hypothetical protein